MDLQQQRTTRPNYSKLRIAPDQILQLLTQCYTNQVHQQRREVVECAKELESVAKWLHISTTKPWLIIYGSIGNGKTTTAKAITAMYEALKRNADERLKERWQIPKEGQPPLEQLQALQIPTICTAQQISAQAGNNPEEYNKVKNSPILIIDDVGIEPTRVMHFGTEISPIAELLYHRYDRRMMTIITTNKDFEELSATYGERIADRLKEVASKVGYIAKSYR